LTGKFIFYYKIVLEVVSRRFPSQYVSALQEGGSMIGKVRVANFSVSIDGFGAGPQQDLAHPLGRGGAALHEWAFATRTFHRMLGTEGGSTDADDEFASRGFANIGAYIIGRNMFGPVRGPWLDDAWKGW
jgi:hypothetical protein